MREKWFVRKFIFGEFIVVGLRIDRAKKIILIGGSISFDEEMLEIADQFGLLFREAKVTRNGFRLQYTWDNVDMDDIDAHSVEQRGYQLEATRGFRRLMR